MGGNRLNKAKLRILDKEIKKLQKVVKKVEQKEAKCKKSKERQVARNKVRSRIFQRKYDQTEREINKFSGEIISLAGESDSLQKQPEPRMASQEEIKFQESYHQKGPWCKQEKSIIPVWKCALRQSSEVLELHTSIEDMQFS